MNFLASQPIFADWTKMSLAKLRSFFQEKQVSRKTFIYKEGSPVTKIYLVKQGELKLFKTVPIHHKDSLAKVSPHPNRKVKQIEIAIVSQGEFLGIEDLILHKPHSNSCESTGSNAEFYEIDAHVMPR